MGSNSKMRSPLKLDQKSRFKLSMRANAGSQVLRRMSTMQDENGRLLFMESKLLQNLAEEILNKKERSIDMIHKLKKNKSEVKFSKLPLLGSNPRRKTIDRPSAMLKYS